MHQIAIADRKWTINMDKQIGLNSVILKYCVARRNQHVSPSQM